MSIAFTYSTTTVTVNRNPSYDSDFSFRRANQYSQETVDGALKTYDGGPNILIGEIVLRNVSKAEGDALRNFIKTTVLFELYQFTITPPANTDIGGGVGTALTTVNFAGGQDLKGLFKYSAPGTYTITIPYRKVV